MQQPTSKQAIFLMGPTAVGKTALALEIYQRLPATIISVDSAMIYRGMDIGTGKPDATTMAKIPHALVDILDPAQAYSVGDFCADAYQAMCVSVQQGRIPILVGGTMMYFWALQQGLAELPATEPAVRARIMQEMAAHGLAALHKKLTQLDPVAAAKIKPTDPQRIQRALEVIEISGKPFSSFMVQQQTGSTDSTGNIGNSLLANWQIHHFILAPLQRVELHQRIESRFKAMLQQGLIAEVEKLYARDDLHVGLPALRTVGYRQIWEYLRGHTTYQEMQERAIAATRQLAKRQFTWLRRWQRVHMLPMGVSELSQQVLQVLTKI